MKKNALFSVLIPLLMATTSTHVMALSCSSDAKKNRVDANNYIFQLLDYIDTPTKGIEKEVRTTSSKEKANEISSVAEQTINYDRDGLIQKSDYDLYSNKNVLLYSERLNKTNSGWKNIIEDYEDKRSSIIKFVVDQQGRIVQSQQEKSAADFIFIQTDAYLYDSNNCLINKQGEWQLKGLDEKGKFTGIDDYGASRYTFQYSEQANNPVATTAPTQGTDKKNSNQKSNDVAQARQLAKILYDFSNNTHAENLFVYQYDKNNHLVSIQSLYTTKAGTTPYLTKFINFNDKNDWLSAVKQRLSKDETRQTETKRVISYY
ncbi:hypothetical protein PT273_00215 [Orbaceae bacterium ESL0727]|nr:hypothetical protein [Orbaceae bacterium ESL0727]